MAAGIDNRFTTHKENFIRSPAFNSLSRPWIITRKLAEERPTSLGTQAKAWQRDGEGRLLSFRSSTDYAGSVTEFPLGCSEYISSISFGGNPLADIGWTICQLDTFGFAARQEFHGITVDQCYVLQIEHDVLPSRFQTKEPLQLQNVLGLDSATQRKNHCVVTRPLDPKHDLRSLNF
jgi:hypothetical protein